MQIDVFGRAYIEVPETNDWEATLDQTGVVESAIFSGASPQLCGLMALKRFVLMRLIQKDWNSKYKPLPIPRANKQLIEIHADFWHCAIEVLQRLDFKSDILPMSKFQTFKMLFLEDGLTLDSVIAPERETASSLLKLIQHQNKLLLALENPFDRESFPVTWEFVNQTIRLGERNDQFRTRYHNPMVRSRGKIATYKKMNRVTVSSAIDGQFVRSRQGRNKKAGQ